MKLHGIDKLVLFFLCCGMLGFADAQILYDNFSSDSGIWNKEGTWTITAGTATDSPSQNYANNTDTSLTLSAPLDLGAAVRPALLIQHRYAIEPVYDAAIIEASTNQGSSWEELERFSGNVQSFQQTLVDLSSYSGESDFLIRFRLLTDNSVVHDGWYIDSVLIDEIPDPATITSVTNNGLSSVTVEWSAPTEKAVESYTVYRTLSADTPISKAVLVGTTDNATLSITDYSIAPKSTLFYRVKAADSYGLYSLSEPAGITLPAGMDYPFLDTGEVGPTYWKATGSWALAPEPGNPSNTCWTDSPDSTYTNSSNTSLTLAAPADFSDVTAPVFAFRQKYDLQSGDILSVEISTSAGEEWISLQSFTAGTSTNEWTQENISLADYIGEEQVLIRFLLTTTASGVADGVWLDNIAIAEAPSAVTSLIIDEVQSHSVRLSWPKNNDVLFSHYAVYREKGASGADFHSELAAEIPDQSQIEYTDSNLLLNTDYAYRVYAVSSYKTLSIEAQEATVQTENHPAPFSDDFESGTNGWVLTGNWNIETNESGAFLCDSPYSSYDNNLNYDDNYARTAVDLSDAEWPVLTFSDAFSFTGNDRGYLQISKDGSNWST
ncbi:MAG: hypothetical protein JXR25_12705, partial [Pontiellaceae bacterium]|nr:hypothetical protein [Pontiellaceae bacterium]MBN2785677.1 hypothetical protein [Pontiellaceae bacterium]